MPSNGDFVPNVIKKVLNLPIKGQEDALGPNFSLLHVWSAAMPIALL